MVRLECRNDLCRPFFSSKHCSFVKGHCECVGGMPIGECGVVWRKSLSRGTLLSGSVLCAEHVLAFSLHCLQPLFGGCCLGLFPFSFAVGAYCGPVWLESARRGFALAVALCFEVEAARPALMIFQNVVGNVADEGAAFRVPFDVLQPVQLNVFKLFRRCCFVIFDVRSELVDGIVHGGGLIEIDSVVEVSILKSPIN